MMDYYERSRVGAAEINLAGRKHSVKMANQASIIRNNVADRTYRNDHEAQRDDEETVSAAHSKMMAQRRRSTVLETKKQAKALRGHVFDDMYNHFGYQRVDPSVRSNTSLAHPGSGDMWFGDLDFSADAAALFEQSDPTPTPPNKQRSPLPMMCFGDLDFAADAAALFEQSDPTPPNEQRCPLSKEVCARGMEHGINDVSVQDAQIKLNAEECARDTGRRTR